MKKTLSNESLRGSWRRENRKERQSLWREMEEWSETTGRRRERCLCVNPC